MGNRGGRIHDQRTKKLLRRRWASKRWICCVTRFKNRHREVMGAGYTELFFLDEVTALACGHRPCFECRRKDATRFSDFWKMAIGLKPGSVADQMDDRLHSERIREQDKRSVEVEDIDVRGVIVKVERDFFTKSDKGWLAWSLTGYRQTKIGRGTRVEILTPQSIISVLQAGYKPCWHRSANH